MPIEAQCDFWPELRLDCGIETNIVVASFEISHIGIYVGHTYIYVYQHITLVRRVSWAKMPNPQNTQIHIFVSLDVWNRFGTKCGLKVDIENFSYLYGKLESESCRMYYVK